MTIIKYITYNNTTGVIISYGECLDILLSAYQTKEQDVITVEDFTDPIYYKVDLETKKVIPRDPDTALLMNKIRYERNVLLICSDWTDTASAQERLGSDLYAEWQTYRQSLRDFPDTCDIENPIWPTPPK